MISLAWTRGLLPKRMCCVLLVLAFSQPLAAQSVALISDLNGRYGSQNYAERIEVAIGLIIQSQPDLVISSGDMVAGQKQPELDADQLDRMWQAFNRVVTDPLARAGIPFVVTAGNHDASAFPPFELEQQRFQAQWNTRKPELEMLAGSEWPTRYAARMGGVLLLTFDGTRPGKLDRRELEFIQQMLQTHGVPAALTIVFSHLPMWPLATGREQEIIDDPELLALLHGSGVDIYVSGHHHVFYAGTDQHNMIHLGLGALGGNARSFSGSPDRQPHSFATLDIGAQGIIVKSYAAPAFNSAVPRGKLPEFIKGPLGTLLRMDGPVRLRAWAAD